MWEIPKQERLEPLAEYQQMLADVFGLNRFGGPNFKLGWGQTNTYEAATHRGYETRLVGRGNPGWMILKWLPPEAFFTPELYYLTTADEETGLALLGEYPQFGTYVAAVEFFFKRFDEDLKEMIIETVDLSWDIIDRMIPMIKAAEEMTYWQIQAAEEEQERKENEVIVSRIADELYDRLPDHYGPTSYRSQGNRTSVLDRKMAEILEVWKRERVSRNKQPRRGFFQN